MTLFENILSDLDARYVDAVDTRRLFETGVGAMLRSLDPYTEFENRKDAVAMNEMVTGKYAGVGLVIAERPVNEGKLDLKEETLKSLAVDAEDERSPFDAQKDDGFELDLDAAKSYLEAEDDDAVKPKTVAKTADKKKVQTEIRVVTAFEGYAFDAGMRPGDKLVAVDGTTIKGSTAEQVRLMLRGEPGTEVSVDFERDGVQGISNVQIPRRLVKIPDIKLTTFLGEKKEGIGYVQLSAFSGDTGAEMRQSILALQKAAERADLDSHRVGTFSSHHTRNWTFF
uniref:PDZ domain-containing protein n=1 Tax=Corethron hystrix TaxID=216773 RepID=A0A7S1FLL2_9STRA|mmetsp:Transcript_11584/g.25373  ORF Transcript_11584/g.25373 Transcript_11584/m.25373 type:complete len:283 (+) Transcript_11584:1426-2274(+)